MKFIIISLLLCSELISAKLTEVLSDDFNTQSIDENKWKFLDNYGGGQVNFTREGVRVENSMVCLNVWKSDATTNDNKSIYTASGLHSIQGWTYGVFEINCSLELNTGRVAVQLVAKKEIYGKGVINGIITVFTNLRGKTGLGVHYSSNDEAINKTVSLKNKTENLIKTGFHVFTLEWNETNIIWKIDNKIVGKLKLNRILSKSYTKMGQPFDQEFGLFISTDYGYPEFAAETGLENSSFIIDYVKVFKLIDDEPENPDKPDKQTTTEKPDKPTTTEKPDKPTTTEKPDKPVKEEKPGQQEKPDKKEKEVNRNKRADNEEVVEHMSNVTQIICIFVPLFVVLAILFLTGYFIKRKWRKDEEREAANAANLSHFQIVNDPNSLNQKVIKNK